MLGMVMFSTFFRYHVLYIMYGIKGWDGRVKYGIVPIYLGEIFSSIVNQSRKLFFPPVLYVALEWIQRD